MTESIPSSVQPPHEAQKPRIWLLVSRAFGPRGGVCLRSLAVGRVGKGRAFIGVPILQWPFAATVAYSERSRDASHVCSLVCSLGAVVVIDGVTSSRSRGPSGSLGWRIAKSDEASYYRSEERRE